MKFRLWLLLVFASISSLSIFPQTHRIVRISEKGAGNPAEVSVAINPKNPDNIIGVSFQYGKPGTARVTNWRYVTNDGGKTGTTISAANPRNMPQGDDSIAFSSEGIAHPMKRMITLAVNKSAQVDDVKVWKLK